MRTSRLTPAGACIVLIGALAGLAASASDDSPPVQTIPLVERPDVTLDGNLAEPVWQQAGTFSPFLIAGTATPAPIQTEVRAFCTREALYFGIVCRDPAPAKLKAVCREHDGPVWSDDSVEIFINPADQGYCQFLVNPLGTRADLAYPAPEGLKSNLAWDPTPDWEAKTQVGPQGWCVEARIPYAAVWHWQYPPQPGEHFRLKLCRTVPARGGNTDTELATAWNRLPGAVYSTDANWRLALLDRPNLLSHAEFATWAGLSKPPSGWTFEAGPYDSDEKRGSWKIVPDPQATGGAALELRQEVTGPSLLPRLFAIGPFRRDRTYEIRLKLKGTVPVFLLTKSGPWQGSTQFTPPPGGWQSFTPVRFEFTVGKSSPGENGHFFVCLQSRDPAAVLISDPEMIERPTLAPQSQRNLVKWHGLEALAESNFGRLPLELLRAPAGGFVGPRVIYRDTVTGADIWKVTHFLHLDRLLETGGKSWSVNGEFFAYTSYYFPESAMHMLLPADATRLLPQQAVSGPARWSRTERKFIGRTAEIVAYDPATGVREVVFRLPDDAPAMPGDERMWFDYAEESGKVLQYTQSFGRNAVLRLWDLATGAHEDVPIRSVSAAAFKDKDWLYSAAFTDNGRAISYGLNHKPYLSDDNRPQGWTYELQTRAYTVDAEVDDPASHGATSPAGKCVGYYAEGLCWRPAADRPRQYIGGLGGDGHMAWLYQDTVAVSGDVSDESLISMIIPEARNRIPVAYAQNRFTGYYGSIVFVSMSPDVTKLAYTSDMLGYRDIYWAIMNYPQPPVDVRAAFVGAAVAVRWAPPVWHAEIAGYHVYRSAVSGSGYLRLTAEPVQGTQYTDAAATPGRPWFYVLRAVERSGLVSRRFSEEAPVLPAGAATALMVFREAESFAVDQVPFRLRLDQRAVNGQYLEMRPLPDEPVDQPGTLRFAAQLPRAGPWRLWARVRFLPDKLVSGRLAARVGAAAATEIETLEREWTWKAFPTPWPGSAAATELVLTSTTPGVGVDRVLLTDDMTYVPSGCGGDIPSGQPAAVTGLAVEGAGAFHVALAWTASPDPELSHYQVYRRRGDGVEASQACLVRSPSTTRVVDYQLQPGQAYTYTVTAVDNWGHESAAAKPLSAATRPLLQRVAREVVLAEVPAAVAALASAPGSAASAKGVFVLRGKAGATASLLELPFEVPVDGDYVIWLHGAAADSDFTCYRYQVDGGPGWRCRLPSRDLKPGQEPTERIQWDCLMAAGVDAGTAFALKAGKHVLTMTPDASGDCALLLDRMLVTNDASYIPPGERFLW